jgi:hypothetical protein
MWFAFVGLLLLGILLLVLGIYAAKYIGIMEGPSFILFLFSLIAIGLDFGIVPVKTEEKTVVPTSVTKTEEGIVLIVFKNKENEAQSRTSSDSRFYCAEKEKIVVLQEDDCNVFGYNVKTGYILKIKD